MKLSERIGGFAKSPFFEPANWDEHKSLFQFDDAVNNGFWVVCCFISGRTSAAEILSFDG